MTIENSVLISAALIKNTAEQKLEAEATIADKARLCFELSFTESCGWLLSNDDKRFRAGCAALLLLSDEESQEKINKELLVIQSLGAAMSGIQIKMDDALANLNPIGLLGLYNNEKAKFNRE